MSGISTGRVQYTRVLQVEPKLADFDFKLQFNLQVPARGNVTHIEPAGKLEYHK